MFKGVSRSLGVALDTTEQHVYFTDYSGDDVMRMDYDGSNDLVIVHGGCNQPRALALDAVNRFC